ncbi:hypothetical protein [Flavobacterium tistrianum]|uniref:hypothetical protein n=1 Tax=Flavobacterium tistrianum TaxID=1685414 RepID=UPI0013A67274|nr:hypothetical protein [Flavobacterium tistrianum]KAF2340409.1 hypothetical protein DMB71_14875 [Flavobacterium tistrianum]
MIFKWHAAVATIQGSAYGKMDQKKISCRLGFIFSAEMFSDLREAEDMGMAEWIE